MQAASVSAPFTLFPLLPTCGLAPLDAAADDLDARCERLLRRHFSLRIDFTTEAAIPPLVGGAVHREAC